MVAPSNSVLIDFGLVFSFAATGFLLLRVIGFVPFSLHFLCLFVCLSVCVVSWLLFLATGLYLNHLIGLLVLVCLS